MFSYRAAAGTDSGRPDKGNFDVVHLHQDPLLAVVADGMGVDDGSRFAGRTTVDTLAEQLTPGSADPLSLRTAVAAAQQAVAAERDRVGTLVGCTLTVLAAGQAGLWVAQLGDCRLYRLRAGLLELLTSDHNYAWTGLLHGKFPLDSSQWRRASRTMARFVGAHGDPDPDILHLLPRRGDIYLACSDGISDQLPYDGIRDVLGEHTDPATAVHALITGAEQAGGADNASAIVIHTS